MADYYHLVLEQCDLIWLVRIKEQKFFRIASLNAGSVAVSRCCNMKVKKTSTSLHRISYR
jgi:hypothetical protein